MRCAGITFSSITGTDVMIFKILKIVIITSTPGRELNVAVRTIVSQKNYDRINLGMHTNR
jgi:hypothetical protein